MSRLKSILVANRGEIAVRVLRTAREQGYRTVAVYSDADARAPHVAMADRAVHIGPSPAAQSYLAIDRIIAAATESGADAVHPGYGFLSENAEFARRCDEAGLTFIGPPADAIQLMGNKAQAKRRMIEAGVPCVPGYEGQDQSDAVFAAQADEIGYPVMVKAAAGGGGRGMRLVDKPADLAAALKTARSEAASAFGSDELILEKAILRPRHVEMQVFADDHGSVIHLGERDCSVQRRHQKVVEEAPCPVMTEELRQDMGAAAVEAARSIGYRGAGTVEFLLDADGAFYFLEMNTRLQVEHPVTEMVTGYDLVAMQLRVAEGRPLGVAQEDVTLSGHAIEVRLYAEDPAQGFLPSTGTLSMWRPPEAPDVRVDSGVEEGVDVSPFYDPMIAKVIVHGRDRDSARGRLVAALQKTAVLGVQTNTGFLIEVLENPTFADGEATTALIADEFSGLEAAPPDFEEIAVGAVLNFVLERNAATERALGVAPSLLGWSSNGALVTRYHYGHGDADLPVDVRPVGGVRYSVSGPAGSVVVDLGRLGEAGVTAEIDGKRRHAFAAIPEPGYFDLSVNGRAWRLRSLIAAAASQDAGATGGRIVAPMHGRIVDVFVSAGDMVKPGSRLLILEAMKMQHEITAETDGTVAQVACKTDDQVGVGDLLVEIEVAEDVDGGDVT